MVGEGDFDYYRKVEDVQDKMKGDLEQRMVMRERASFPRLGRNSN